MAVALLISVFVCCFCCVFVVAQTPAERAQKMLAQMTIDEKIEMVHGADGPYVGNVPANTRLGIPAIKMNDGPQGFRDDAHPGTTTQWPSCLTMAATFDPSLFNDWGVAMGVEFAGKGSNVQLGPGVNVARVPRNGRNFEYLSGEDPYLGAQNAAMLVKGIQSQGVIANAKHYIHNNQETDRTTISANVDERTRMEIYMPPFEGAVVQGGLLSIMCSYNKINSTYACENDETLNKNLKQYVGFGGWVMSDWGATHSTQGSANSGLDQEMPGSGFFGSALKSAIESGSVPLSRLNDMVLRILTALYAIGEFDKPVSGSITNDVTSPEHNKLARTFASHAITLLKNNGNLLPLYKPNITKVAVFNPSASTSVVTGGGGSGSVAPKYQVSPLAGLQYALNGNQPREPCVYDTPNYDYYQPGNPSSSAKDATDCCAQCRGRQDCNAWTFYNGLCYFKPDNSGRVYSVGRQSGTVPPVNGSVAIHYYYGTDPNAAAPIAAAADVAVCVMATSSSEGFDRDSLSLSTSEISICKAVGAAARGKTVAVVITPGAVLTDWSDSVDAVLVGFMPGQEEGNAIADVLFGEVNPGGKLPVTFPNVENEVGFLPDEYPGVGLQEYYRERLNVGYRWYAAHSVTPRYPFGFGLSYTTFQLSNLVVTPTTGAPPLSVKVSVKNTGKVSGSEVVQVYLGFPQQAGEPPLQLKGFQKVLLQPAQTQTLSFTLSERDFSIWDETTHAWTLVLGQFLINVGTNSQNLPLKQACTIS